MPRHPWGLFIGKEDGYRSRPSDPDATKSGFRMKGYAGVTGKALEGLLTKALVERLWTIYKVPIFAVLTDGDSRAGQIVKAVYPAVEVLLCVNHWRRAMRKRLQRLEGGNTKDKLGGRVELVGGKSYAIPVPKTFDEVISATRSLYSTLQANAAAAAEAGNDEARATSVEAMGDVDDYLQNLEGAGASSGVEPGAGASSSSSAPRRPRVVAYRDGTEEGLEVLLSAVNAASNSSMPGFRAAAERELDGDEPTDDTLDDSGYNNYSDDVEEDKAAESLAQGASKHQAFFSAMLGAAGRVLMNSFSSGLPRAEGGDGAAASAAGLEIDGEGDDDDGSECDDKERTRGAPRSHVGGSRGTASDAAAAERSGSGRDSGDDGEDAPASSGGAAVERSAPGDGRAASSGAQAQGCGCTFTEGRASGAEAASFDATDIFAERDFQIPETLS